LRRLAKVLRAAGYEVTVPGCARCGADRDVLVLDETSRRVCTRCAPPQPAKQCARCGGTGRIAARRPEGGICYGCYRRDPQVTQPCAQCGRERIPAVRRADGQPVCERCWQRPQHECSGCGAVGPAKMITDTGALCPRCYRQQRDRGECGLCGQQALLACRATDTEPARCYRCYRRPQRRTGCRFCGQLRSCVRLAGEDWVCRSCLPTPKRTCGHCGTIRRVAANWPLGPVCPSCYAMLRYAGRPCRRCGQVRPLTSRDQQGTEVCGPCTGQPSPPPCRTCGDADAYAHGQCARCILTHRLRDDLAGPDGHITPQLAPLRETLTATDHPVRILTWLQSSSSAQLLARLAASGQHVTHDMLDELPAGHDECYVRALLVRTGILTPRQEALERITPWLDRVLTGRPSTHARIVQPYVHWVLLRKARRRAAQGRPIDRAGERIRAETLLVLDLLAWLDDRRLTLATLRQGHLEDWLASGPSRRHDISMFLTWAHRRGLTVHHDISRRPNAPSPPMLTDEQRWTELRHCLTSDTLPLRVRVARALTLLYGLPATRIRRLTAADIEHRGDETYLRHGADALLLPPRLAQLLTELATSTRDETLLPAADAAHQWLFPGNVPGQPFTPAGFSLLLSRHGFRVVPARNAALVALAEQLPAPVLAQLLGISIQTAHKWAAFTQPNWSAYLAVRDRDLTNGTEE
jgi:hypothetical protein